MEGLIIFFMIFAGLVCAFAVFTVVHDFYKERTDVSKKQKGLNEKEEKEAQVREIPATAVATVPVAVNEPEEAINDQPENGVWIARAADKTHVDKYADLAAEARARYDEIKAYAMNKQDVVARMGVRAEDFRIGKRMVARLIIRRDIVCCEYLILHRDFNGFIADSKVNVKHAAAVIKIDSDEAVAVAKSSIDLAVREIEEDKRLRLEMQKARRRENRARRNGVDSQVG